ncbi:MAG: PLP-dependent aminotransferase family protein [Filifactoraceae bacterium]
MRYSERMTRVREDIIGKILSVISKGDIISFAGGLPDESLFPLDEMEKAGLSIDKREAFQYSLSEGNRVLREELVKIMGAKSVECNLEDIIITSGSQQGLDLSGKLFLDKDDIVITEAPSYLGAINAFDVYQPRYEEVSMDEDGIIPEKVEDVLKAKKVKFIYLVPDFQNPTGRTLSVERRKRLVEIATKYQVPIIEDNPYGELCFNDKPYPAIKSFDKEGWVIYLGSLSKMFCPGIRIGYIVADRQVLGNYLKLKEATDLQSNGYAQAMAAEYLKNNDITQHIKSLCLSYEHKKEVMLTALKKEFPLGAEFTNPKGGLFIWVKLPEYVDTEELLILALEEKVAFIPGVFFYPYRDKHNELRLNYSSCNIEEINEGIRRLGYILKNCKKTVTIM